MRAVAIALAGLLLLGCAPAKKAKVKMRGAEVNTDGPGVRRTLARALQAQDKHEEALRQLRAAQKEEGKRPSAKTLTLIGISLRELGFYPEAFEALDQSLTLDAKDAEAWDAMGVLEQLMNKPASAQRRFLAACRLHPDNPEFQNNLGFSLYLAGDFDGAAESIQRALALEPDNIRYRNNFGFVLGALRRDTEARASFQAAVPPAMVENNLGVVYERRGDEAKAKVAYEAALSLDPSLEEAQRNLARLVLSRVASPTSAPQ